MKKRMRGRGLNYLTTAQRGALEYEQLRTASNNLRLDQKRMSAKPPLQQPGRLGIPVVHSNGVPFSGAKWNGIGMGAKSSYRAYVDRDGGFIRAF